jgi:alanine racemase
MLNTVTATIDLAALRMNLSVVRSLCPQSRILAMIKADAYGHGLLSVARALESADGFGVARLAEALQLREAGFTQRVLLLGTLLDNVDLALCSRHGIDVTAHDEPSLRSIVTQAHKTPLRVWLELDSGMHRLGFDPKAFMEADRALKNHPGVSELIHMTHFSSAEDTLKGVADRQIECFEACRRERVKCQSSLANSAALISKAETRVDWVRPGIMLYGCNPFDTSSDIRLHPAMTLRARVIAIRDVKAGESVGYNERWTSGRSSRIATIGIGYGDGYPRHVRSGTPVWLHGDVAPVVGQISMDSLTVDLTDHPGASVGDEATLWGAELPVAIIAECAGTIAHEVLTSLSQRVDRQYIGR